MTYFDIAKNQYPITKIFQPPKYVVKETTVIIEILKKEKINYVIDFGAGTGRLTIPLLKNNIKTIAIDISKKSLKKLYQTAKKLKLEKRLTLKTQLDQKNRIKALVGCDILHHVNLDKYLPFFYQALEKKGKIIFSEPNFLNPSWLIFISLFLNWKEEWRIIYLQKITLINKLKKYGFKKIQFINLGILPLIFFEKLPFFQKINYWLGNLPVLNLFAYRIILQAEK